MSSFIPLTSIHPAGATNKHCTDTGNAEAARRSVPVVRDQRSRALVKWEGQVLIGNKYCRSEKVQSDQKSASLGREVLGV